MPSDVWQYSKRQAAQGTPREKPLPPSLPPDAAALLQRFGLHPFDDAPCCGYANACVCWRCADRQDRHVALRAAGADPFRAAVGAKRDNAIAIARRGARKGPRD